MPRSPLLRLLALAAILVTAGCLHLGTQQRGWPGRDDFSVAPPPPPPPAVPPVFRPSPFHLWHRELRGVPAYIVRVDLSEVRPRVVLAGGRSCRLPDAASFEALLKRAGPGIVSSGAFFGERSHRIIGTIVSDGRICQPRHPERRGTALEIRSSGRATLRTTRIEATLGHCRFLLQAGPRLVRDGRIWLHPRFEGFEDPVLLGRARRVAVGLEHRGRVLLLVAFPSAISLRTEALAMRDLGCQDAMNLDGGSSAALAVGRRILVEPTTPLTHVLVFSPRLTETRAGRSNAPSRADRTRSSA